MTRFLAWLRRMRWQYHTWAAQADARDAAEHPPESRKRRVLLAQEARHRAVLARIRKPGGTHGPSR